MHVPIAGRMEIPTQFRTDMPDVRPFTTDTRSIRAEYRRLRKRCAHLAAMCDVGRNGSRSRTKGVGLAGAELLPATRRPATDRARNRASDLNTARTCGTGRDWPAGDIQTGADAGGHLGGDIDSVKHTDRLL